MTRLALSHLYLPGHRNRLHLHREEARQQLRFGRWIFVSTLLTFFAGQLDRLIFGKTIPLDLLGVYSIATMLATLPTQAILKLGGAVVFPAYSRVAGRDDFEATFWRVRGPLVLGGAALACLLIAAGPFVVSILYDARYAEAGTILQFLSAAAWFQVLECTTGAALLAKGRVSWVAAGSASKVVGMLALIPVGFHVGGFRGALVAVVVSEALKYATAVLGAARSGLRGFHRDVGVTLALAASAAVGYLAGRAVGGRGPLAALAVSVMVGAAPWVVVGVRLLRRARTGQLAART